VSEQENTPNRHLDEITLLLYVERQLDRESAQEVSLHTQTCTSCMTLLRALDRESRLLTRSMLEEDEPLPARLAQFHATVKKSMQWIWGVVFGLAALGIYALYTGYIEPAERELEKAGFGGTNLLSLLLFQGAFWKGWQSMFTLVEFVALASVAGFGLFLFRRYLKKASALAVMFASLGFVVAFGSPAAAMEFRKADSVQIKKDEVIKGDLYATGENVRVDGTVDGDVYIAGKQVVVSGHVTGEVFCACQSLRIDGQVEGSVRNASNNLTITGSVGRNVTSFSETTAVDSSGKVGHSVTAFSKSLTVDGTVGGDVLAFVAETTIGGSIEGEIRVHGDSLSIGSNASIGGKASFEGNNPADVASGAKLASPITFTKIEHSRTERGGGYYVWRVIWASAFILFGLVLLWVLPQFSKEAAANVENVGASFGLGVLVGFALPIAAILSCVTVVGLFVGLSAFFLWFASLYFSQIVVGAAVGSWILGRTNETWPLVGRMAIGMLILRACMAVPFIGGWVKIAVILWGIGAISLAAYRRLQPVMAPSIPPVPMAHDGTPLPPNTTVGGV
jgi:cytoskeletal protein CcmA (bactofilin family)